MIPEFTPNRHNETICYDFISTAQGYQGLSFIYIDGAQLSRRSLLYIVSLTMRFSQSSALFRKPHGFLAPLFLVSWFVRGHRLELHAGYSSHGSDFFQEALGASRSLAPAFGLEWERTKPEVESS